MSIAASNRAIEAEAIVEGLEPSTGWWQSDTPDRLKTVVETLLGHDVPDDVIGNALEITMSIVRGEYGE